MIPSRVLKKAAQYLAQTQLESGGFESVSLLTKFAKEGDRIYQTTFFPSLVLLALQHVQADEVMNIKARITNFLIDQKGEEWSFNYWDRTSNEHQTKPYPDDLDDTFCALAALYTEKPELFTPSTLARIAMLLIRTEQHEGGPYKTWLTTSSKPAWNDVDLVVNANIARFLSRQGVELSSITDLIEQAVAANKLSSPYYANIYPIINFVAGWYTGDHQQNLIEKLITRKHGAAWRHPQRTALAITSLLRLGYDHRQLQPAVEYLINLQQTDGGWEAEAFCADPSVDGRTRYGASRALSTSLCMEALALYESKLQKNTPARTTKRPKQQFEQEVQAAILERIALIRQVELKDGLQAIYGQINKQDTDSQIVMLPMLVAKSFQAKVSPEVLQQLSCINVWGWMAYTTYDDFLDGEGDPRLLPAANVCLRFLSERLVRVLPSVRSFHDEASEIMERLDAANAWELANCRGRLSEGILHIKQIPDYTDYWQLADRSLGHAISGLGALYAGGLSANDSLMIAFRKFMKHYLIARQLNDDAHDWYDDLSRGHVNAVAAALLRVKYPTLPKAGLKIDVASKKGVLQQLLWEEVIDQVCSDTKYHIELARAALHQNTSGLNMDAFEKLLLPIEAASTMALTKRNEALEFIAAL